MYGFCGEYGMVRLNPYGMLWYVSKHKHKEILGTFSSVGERLEAFGKRLNSFRAFWERMVAVSRLGSLGTAIPYGILYVSKGAQA